MDEYGDDEGTEIGSIIKKIGIKNLEQLRRLVKDYKSGKLLDNWKQWFEECQPQINRESLVVEIVDDKHKYLEAYFQARKIWFFSRGSSDVWSCI